MTNTNLYTWKDANKIIKSEGRKLTFAYVEG